MDHTSTRKRLTALNQGWNMLVSHLSAYHVLRASWLLRTAGLGTMTSLKSIGLGLLLAFIATSAMGFQEQQSGSGAAQQSAAPSSPNESKPAQQLTPNEQVEVPSSGREVRIPGIGKLGVLPKMDFGLELLYGANEPKAPLDGPRDNSEDLTIRGSVKHRF